MEELLRRVRWSIIKITTNLIIDLKTLIFSKVIQLIWYTTIKKNMPKLSVLSPSIRPKGLEPVMQSLKEQTEQSFEWLVEVSCPWKGHDLNAAMNRLLRRATGDIIVIAQDYLTLPTDSLEKIADLHQVTEKTCFTYPVLKTNVLGDSSQELRGDWRPEKNDYIPYYRWETDFASAPRQAFLDIGGYDEDFDKGWSWDNVNVAHRMKMAGYAFRCYPFIPATAWDHDRFEKHPFRGKKENGDLNQEKSLQIEKGLWKLNNL